MTFGCELAINNRRVMRGTLKIFGCEFDINIHWIMTETLNDIWE